MPEGLVHLFARRPASQVFTDLFDLLIVAYVIYRALLVLRGTRAMQMGTGLLLIFLIYLAAKWLALITLLNLLSTLLSSIILIVVVVFQNDIRRGLMRVGSRAFLGGFARAQESRVIDEVVASATELARHRMGALIAFEQDANLDEFVVAQGIPVESTVTRELLVSLFVPESVNKLHDGAVIIRNLRIAKAGVFFPMPESRIVDTSLGSRHRAAIGITEETDAVVVVVSEERGTISFCFSGNIVSNLDGASLRQALLGLFGRKSRKKGAKKTTPAPGRPSFASLSGVRTTLATPIPAPSPLSPTPVPRPSSEPPPPSATALPIRTPVPTRPSTPPTRVSTPPTRASTPTSIPPPADTESSDDPESGRMTTGTELPESPPPKGRGTPSSEEANE
ncbi:MAG: diadenylate cyclase CdaA [Polyangiaceae bacterium]